MQFRNQILSALSEPALALIQPILRRQPLPAQSWFEHPGRPIEEVVFPESGIISVVARNERGGRIEVGLIGREGMSGLAVLLGADHSPNETYVQLPGEGHAASSADLQRVLAASTEIRATMSRYALGFLAQTTQTALANGRARIEERLARWLLMARDRVDGDDIPLTHELIALMLGVRRPGVTDALHRLEGDGHIRAKRGVITVRDRGGLERAAGGSYGVAEAEYRRLMI